MHCMSHAHALKPVAFLLHSGDVTCRLVSVFLPALHPALPGMTRMCRPSPCHTVVFFPPCIGGAEDSFHRIVITYEPVSQINTHIEI